MDSLELPNTALAPYKVIDLTTSEAWSCGKWLADLGADVIKIEPPGGDPGRRQAPYAHHSPNAENGLRWQFMNMGKRSLVLDFHSLQDRKIFLKMVREADAVIESYPRGWLDQRGLGYSVLRQINPRLVFTSISPFGRRGPYADYQSSDLILSALSGAMYLSGDEDRPPVRVSVPQYDLQGASEGCVSTIIGLYHGQKTGQGQYIDVSSQLASVRSLMNATQFFHGEGKIVRRHGSEVEIGPIKWPSIFEASDGHVCIMLAGGKLGGVSLQGFMDWAREELEIPSVLDGMDWSVFSIRKAAFDPAQHPQIKALRDTLSALFLNHTKEELYDRAVKERLLLAPVSTVEDIRSDAQLKDRDYFVPVTQYEGDVISYPGRWALLSKTPLSVGRRAPMIGEHNEEILAALPSDSVPVKPAATALLTPKQNIKPNVFEGLKVWDMSWVGVGPLTSRYLADHGAAVIRLDSTASLDFLRTVPPYKDNKSGPNRAMFYSDFNCSKLGLGLNMRRPEAQSIAYQLAMWADVVIESFTPGNMAKWGMSYETLKKGNPGLVMLSTCMQGQTGPRASYPGFGNLMAAMSGYWHITGWPDRGPVPVYGAYTDFVAQRFTTSALISALDSRRRSGAGQFIDVSQYEAALQFLGPEILDYEINGEVVNRNGNDSDLMAPHGVYPCLDEVIEDGIKKDNWIAIAVKDDEQWRCLKDIMGNPDWSQKKSLQHLQGRKENSDLVNAKLAKWTRHFKANDLFHRLQPKVAAGVVNTCKQLNSDPQLKHRQYFTELNHSLMGNIPYNGAQAIFSNANNTPRKASPCIGEDSVEVLTRYLNMTEGDVAALIDDDVVQVVLD